MHDPTLDANATKFGPPIATGPPRSGLAIMCLVAGILGWTLLPVLGSIVAVITGHLALGEIRRESGRVGGKGIAAAGLALGYSLLALIAIVVLVLASLAVVFVGSAQRPDFDVHSVQRALDDLPPEATIEDRVITIVGEQMGLADDEVDLQSTLEDLGSDELDLAELVSSLEEEFEIQIAEDEIEKVKTVGDLVRLVQSMAAEQPQQTPSPGPEPGMPPGP